MTDKPKRRWFQFSLRTLLVFVLLVSIAMSWLAVKIEKARKQREALEHSENAGGLAIYDYEYTYARDDFEGLAEPEPPVPEWLRAIFGDDFFFDVLVVSAYTADFGDDEAVYLKTLSNLEELVLQGTEITDGGLEHIKGLATLRVLILSDNQITDAGLEHVGRMTRLSHLDLSGTKITDAGIEHLEGLTNLVRLSLDDTEITGAALVHLKALTKLEWLCLRDTQVTDAGLASLRHALPCFIEPPHP